MIGSRGSAAWLSALALVAASVFVSRVPPAGGFVTAPSESPVPTTATVPSPTASRVPQRFASSSPPAPPARPTPLHARPARDAGTEGASPAPESLGESSNVAGGPTTATAPAAASSSAPADERVPQVMYCHPDSRGASGAADVLQDCIDRAPAFSSVEIPAGRYVLYRQVVVSRPVTIRTAGSGGTALSCRATPDQCVVLLAAPDLFDELGFLLVRSASHVVLEHLVLDGNRDARAGSTAAQWCQRGRTSSGFNASVIDCVRCGLDDVVSRHALCGTAMVWSGAQATIQRSEFRANGDATTRLMWADGLTALYAPASDIRDNTFVDNSDVALIVGHGARSRIERNVIVQRAQAAFAGLMLHNFHSNNLAFRGDFRGAVITDNTVDCGPGLCVFGIQAGPSPWDPTRNIVGGELHANTVRGAKVGINIDGAGVRLAPIAVYGNDVADVPAAAYFSDCPRPIPTGWMNVSPISVVDRRADVGATAAHLSDSCQLSSRVAAGAP